jgi:Ca2+/Na+ antiporter
VSILVMILSAAAIIAFVKYGLVAAIDQLAGALGWSSKARGQATGFATSAPELVALIAAGLSGVWDAGLWNIASSNIINGVLMLLAVLRYRQLRELMNRRFADELGFAAVAVLAPLLLMRFELDTSWVVVPILFALFATYRVVDRRLNPPSDQPGDESVGSLPLGVILAVTALTLIAVAGIFLGDATKAVVEQMGVRPALAGWILGVVTSLPEVVTFFAVYSTSKREGHLHLLDDTQEVLDNLAASNVANTAFIYPLGLTVFLLVTGLA